MEKTNEQKHLSLFIKFLFLPYIVFIYIKNSKDYSV